MFASLCLVYVFCFFFFKQKTAYEMRISDWSSDVCSSDLSSCRTRRSSGGRAIVVFDTMIAASPLSIATVTISSMRSEERRVGKECVSTCRYRWSPSHEKKNEQSTSET